MLRLIQTQILLLSLVLLSAMPAHAGKLSRFLNNPLRQEHDVLSVAGQTHVLVFLNLNTSIREEARAEAKAKELGLAFASIPSRQAIHELGPLADIAFTANERLESYENLCAKSRMGCDPQRLKNLRRVKEATATRAIEIQNKHEFALNFEFDALIKDLKDRHLKISDLVISGHHSSGGFSGDFLSIRVFSHKKVMSTMHANPEVFSDLSFLAFWGCATVTEETIEFYHTGLPSLKVMAGFYDTAPAGVRDASASYLGDVIAKKNFLLQSKTPGQLHQRIRGIHSITGVLAGLWVKLEETKSYFYYSALNDRGEMETEFEAYGSPAHCDKFRLKFPEDVRIVDTYFFGNKPIPENTGKSDLRNAYYNLLQNYSCYKNDFFVKYTPTQAGALRFFQSVQYNFTRTFQNTIEGAQKELNQNSHLVSTSVKTPNVNAVIKEGSRRDILLLQEQLKALLDQEIASSVPAHAAWAAASHVAELYLYMDRYLYQLDDRCMDMLEWHAERSDELSDAATGKCQLQKSAKTSANSYGFSWIVNR